ncbi:tetratricopeptide repeat protein [Bremerella cremea]|uniref:Tetratricopeptide repeat protein n=2 Tax=Pirellulales TaxID=2691354 RepID=A0A2S8FL06_9BACT|nr:hypothetical protein C5Y83_21890 [Blastopirellula marina]RCS45904.1 tetratricopeptide repeat protein [Bremerella cremea]
MFSSVPRLNYRFIAWLLLGLAVVVAAAFGVHSWQMSRHKDSFLREARRVRDEGRIGDALAHYRRYSLVSPTDVEALSEFGYLLKDVGSYDQAYLILTRALALEPNQDDLRLVAAELAIRLRRFNDAVNLINSLIEKSPDDPVLQERLAICQSGKGDYREARQTLERAIKLDKKNRDYYLHLANLQFSALNSYIEAKKTLDRMVESDPKEPLTYVNRGHWILSVIASGVADKQENAANANIQTSRDYRIEQVQADVDKSLELAPGLIDVNLLAAELALTKSDLDEAAKFANYAKRIAPQEPYPVRLLIRVESLKGDLERAVELSKEAVQVWPKDFQIHWMLANLLIDLQNVEEASPVVDKLRSLSPSPALVALLEARILAVQGKWLESAKLVEANRALLINWPTIASRADFHLGRCYQQLARPDQELNAYRRALAADPTSRDLRLAVANALRDANKFDEAFEEYQVLVEFERSSAESGEGEGVPFEAVVNYFRLLIREESLKSNDQSFDNVGKVLDQLESREPEIEFLPILRAEWLISKGETEEAVELVHKARTESPNKFEYLSAEVMLACQQEDWSAADRMLADGKKEFSADERYWMLRGKYAMLRYGTDAGQYLKEISQSSELQDLEKYPAVVSYLASLAFWIQDSELTKELGQKVVKAEPDQLAIRLLLLEVAFREEDLEAIGPLLAEVEKIDGQHATWNYGEAVRLVLSAQVDDNKTPEDKRLLRAFAHLADAEKLRPGWSRPITFEAQILESQGQEDVALAKYEDAISLGERDPIVVQRTTALLFKRGRYGEVDRLLARLDDNGNKISADLLEAGREAAMQLGNLGRALQLAQDLAGKSGSSDDHVWLAQLLVMLQKPEQAEIELKKAIEISPNMPEPWLGMVSIYAKNGQRDLASQAIEDGSSKLDENKRDIFRGRSYEILGDGGKAEASYRTAIINNPDDVQARFSLVRYYLRTNRQADSIRELRLFLKEELTEDMRTWARRNLAIQLAKEGGDGNTEESLKLLDDNEEAIGQNRQDQIVRATIFAIQPEEEAQKSAIKTLEEVGGSSLSLEEQFLLGKLYATHDQIAKATQLFSQLTIRSSGDPKYLRAYIAALLKNGEVSEAGVWADRLALDLPSHITTVDLQSKVLFAKGRYDEIPPLLNKWLNDDVTSQERGVASHSVQLEWAASKLDEFADQMDKDHLSTASKFRSQANDLRLALKEPAMKLQQATLLVARTQIEPALTMLREIVGKVPAQDFSRTFSYIVGQNPSVTILEEMDEILKEAQKEYSDDMDVLKVAGDVALLRGEFERSRKAYQQVLAGSPEDVHALNNCALAMAFEGGSKEAVVLANKAVAVGGEVPPLLDTRGVTYLAVGDTASAIQDFKKAIASSPLPEYFFHLALAQKRAGKFAESKASLTAIDLPEFGDLTLHESERAAYEELLSTD